MLSVETEAILKEDLISGPKPVHIPAKRMEKISMHGGSLSFHQRCRLIGFTYGIEWTGKGNELIKQRFALNLILPIALKSESVI